MQHVDYSIMEYSLPSTRGFPVEFAALGFLIECPMHGYALRERIAEGLGPLWQVASSQLYQVLHRLEAQEYVFREELAESKGPSKYVYSSTELGRSSFWTWALASVDAMRDVRVEFAAKLYFTRRLRPSAVDTLIENQLDAQERMAAYLASTSRSGSDDAILNEAWNAMQMSTVENFSSWLRSHRSQLATPKESTP